MIILDLIYNLSFLVSLSILSGFISKRHNGTKLNTLLQGILFGTVAVIGMLYPFEFADGIIFDGRSIVISLCSLFFGPLSGLIAALFAVVYRVLLGGSGVIMGVSVISSSFLIGLAFYYWISSKPKKKISNTQLYFFGLIVHLVMIFLMLTLPSANIMNAITEVGVTVIVAYPLAALLIGKILLDNQNAVKVLNELRQRESLIRTTLYSIGDGVIVVNQLKQIIILNPLAELLTGWSEEEAKNQSVDKVFNIIDEGTRKKAESPVDKVFKQGLVVGLANHTLLISKDGNEVPIADSGAPIKNEDGDIIGAVLVFRDQTEERSYQKEISQREKKYRSLYNSIRDAILVVDNSGRMVDCNPACLELFGYSKEELWEQRSLMLYENESEYIKFSDLLKLHSGEREYLLTSSFKKKTNEVFPGETNIFNLTDEEGNQTGLILLIRDVTIRKAAEAALKESEARYSTIFNSSYAVMLIVNPSTGRIVDANEAACEYYGYEKEFLLEKEMSEINVLTQEELLVEMENVRTGKRNHFVFKHKLKSGEIRDVEVYTGKLLVQGEELLYSIIHDITNKLEVENALRESEDKMRLMVEGTPYLFFYNQDLEANITYVSPSVESITGRSVEKWMGQNHWFVTDNPINELAKNRTHSNLRGDVTSEAILVEVTHSNGNPIMLEVYENPVKRDGKVISLQGVAHDITLRERMMAELKSAKDNAEAANKLKTEFLAQMSHEIRSPLNAVLSFASLLEEEYRDEENSEIESIFTGIVSSGQRIIKTIDSILNMSELQLGIYELNFREVNLSEVISRLYFEYKSQAKLKGIKLKQKIELADALVIADEYAVTQIIANLIDNAIKYTQKGYVEISMYSSGDDYVLEVKDTGIGISKKYLPFLFEVFSQEQQGYSRMFEGNGLGLALVKKYAELIDGEIFVESEKGEGSTFGIKLQKVS